MESRDNLLRLSAGEWAFIFRSLDLAKNTFFNNPVLQDTMPEEDRMHFIDDIDNIMEKIGLNGQIAYHYGVASNATQDNRRSSTIQGSSEDGQKETQEKAAST